MIKKDIERLKVGDTFKFAGSDVSKDHICTVKKVRVLTIEYYCSFCLLVDDMHKDELLDDNIVLVNNVDEDEVILWPLE